MCSVTRGISMIVEMSGLGSNSEWFFYAFHPALSSLHVRALLEEIGSYLDERKIFPGDFFVAGKSG